MTDTTRVVAGTIDSATFYGSRLAGGGGFAFLAGVAVDQSGKLAEDATPAGPYGASATAKAHLETRYIYDQWKKALPEIDSSLGDVLQIEQYVGRKVQAEAYFAEALTDEYLGTGTANGATAQVSDYYPLGATISLAGIAVVPDQEQQLARTYPGQDGSPTGKFADPVAAGPYLFTTMFAMDRKAAGLPADVKLPGWSWGGSEIASEANWAVGQLQRKLEAVGGTLSDVVDYTVLLTDLDDLYEFDLVMRKALGENAPSRTALHMRGSALPRREGALGHDDGAARLEVQFRCLNAQAGGVKVSIEGPQPEIGYQSAGVKVDSLLWLSSQSARAAARNSISAEITDIFAQLSDTCSRAGTSADKLLRLRVQLTDRTGADAFFTELRKVFPADPPAVTILLVDALPVPGTSVAIDGVALAES